MPDTSYLCLGGVEISNAARTTTYANTCGLKPHTMSVAPCACPDLHLMLGDAAYTTPQADGAPWVDPARPESYEFAGLLITSIDGLDAAPLTRPVTDRVGDGAVIGRRRLGPRTITVRGILLGGSCCGIDYGMTWLSSALRGSVACGPIGGCAGDDLVYLSCCPPCDGAADPAACAAPHWRTMREVAATSEPRIVNRLGGGCGCSICPALEVEFTLTAGRPHALLPPVTVAEGATWDLEGGDGECVTWVSDGSCQDVAECVPAVNCMDAALAAIGCAPTSPPGLPVPVNPCACQPLTLVRTCVEIPASVLTPIWSDVVLDLEISSGVNALRGVRARFYPDPLGFGTIDDLDPCGYCAEFNVSIVPAHSTLRIDGSTRQITVSCLGGEEVPAAAAVSGADGGPWTWPVLDCGVPYVACFDADAATIADGAQITVRVISREQ